MPHSPDPTTTSVVFGIVLFGMWRVLSSGRCSSCGKRLVHADDCWRRR